jgi:alkylation response protein AidB-like acyl-CoA dehydrogenase
MRWRIEDTPERAAFREEFRGWLREVLQPGWMEAIDAGDETAFAEAFGEAQKNGWNFLSWTSVIGASGYGAPLWPKEYGGLSGEIWMQNVVREELTRYRLPLFGPNILGVGLAGPTIIAHGTEAQKERYLKKILTGEEIWCQLFSEPGSGSDLASVGTRAVRDGDEWVVNGQKVWTSIAQLAKFGMLLARTDPDVAKHEGLTYFVVEMRSPGVEIRPLRQLTGSAEFNEVYFTDVRIPDASRVGDVGEGWRCARTTLANERDTIAGLSLDPTAIMGGGKTRQDPWQEYLESMPDRSDPVVRQHLAQLYIEEQVRQITVFRATAARMRGEQPGPEGSVNKVFNAELNQRRWSYAVTAAGMNGIAWLPGDGAAQNAAHRFLRSRANTIEGGTSEVLRSQIGERVLGLPREPEPDKDVPWRR